MADTVPVSVVIVAKNAAAHLPRCLASVRGWAAEVIVALNDTTDASAEIARAAGAQVHTLAWQGFRDTKNAAAALATQEWVLSLDADEELTEALRQEIARWLPTAEAQGFAAARFPRRTWFLSRWITHGDWYPDHCHRLYRRGRAQWGGGLVHESLTVEGRTATLREDLQHYSFASFREAATKAIQYAELGARQHLAAGKRVSAAEIFTRPAWGFFRCYVVRRGFLDGAPGLVVAGLVTWAKFAKYSAIYEAKRREG